MLTVSVVRAALGAVSCGAAPRPQAGTRARPRRLRLLAAHNTHSCCNVLTLSSQYMNRQQLADGASSGMRGDLSKVLLAAPPAHVESSSPSFISASLLTISGNSGRALASYWNKYIIFCNIFYVSQTFIL